MTERIDFSDAQYLEEQPQPADEVAPPEAVDAEAVDVPAPSPAPESPAAAGFYVPEPAAAAAPATNAVSRLARFGRAWTFGWLAALVSAVIWGGILALTDHEFGLLAIGVGVLVGRAVRYGSYDAGGRGFQALAVFLTWMGITLGYTPAIASGMTDVPYAFAFVFSLFLAPFTPWFALAEGEGLMGLVIIGIGLFEAFRVNSPLPSSGPT